MIAQARYGQQLNYTLTLTAENGQWIVQTIDLMPPINNN